MSAPRPSRLGVGIVGAGRVGAVLGSALRAVGHTIIGASGVSDASRERIDTLLPGVEVLEVQQIVERAELVLLAVPDDALEPLVSGLAAIGAWQPGQIVVHTAGRFGARILAPAQAAGALTIAIHPAMTFTGTSLDLSRLEGTTFAVTCSGPLQPIGQALVVEIGGEPVIVAEEDRSLYHAALAHASNHLVVLVAQAAQALGAAGVADPGRLLAPLMLASLEGALRAADMADPGVPPGPGQPGSIAVLTGPVARADVGTVREHLDALTALAASSAGLDLPESYRTLSRAATQRALTTGRISQEQARELLDSLTPPPAPPPTAPTPGDSVPGPSFRAGARTKTQQEDRIANEGMREGTEVAAVARTPQVVRSRAELAAALGSESHVPEPESARSDRAERAVVMTMGALHSGHVELVRAARERVGPQGQVIVTVFVNPLQFGPDEDFEQYPRDLEGDVERLAASGADVDLVFAPDVEQMYPDGPIVTVTAGRIGRVLEGAARPGHFDGVLTVVLKLLHLIGPDVAVFGEKDAQQLLAVRRMVADLAVPIEILGVPIIRDDDGLALSSRNAYLGTDERRRALALSRALHAARDAQESGTRTILAAARQVLASADIEPDYLVLVDPTTVADVPDDHVGPALVLIAARVGTTRLIDNMAVTVPARAGGAG